MAVNPKKHTAPLSRLKNSAKGKIHHIEIHPAKTSGSQQGFITRIHREASPQAQAKMQAGGNYMPPPEPDETIHEDGQDMIDHVKRHLGIPDEQPDQDEDEE
ncbi:MAG: hypothetical protein ABSD56_01585 [Bryobacteraceae bacterium]|jgi:hypothetical protein